MNIKLRILELIFALLIRTYILYCLLQTHFLTNKNMKLSLGFSTCPNDTFIFDAMVHHKIDTEGLEFSTTLADVEELNKMAFKKQLDVTKLSFNAFAYCSEQYQILDHGSALGRNNGPLVISKKPYLKSDLDNIKIGIPGKYTTANLLFSIAFPQATNKTEILFSDIEDSITNNNIDAGVIIHETRFTYEERGFKKIIDLGEFWENTTGSPIPLGTIAIDRNLPEDIKQKFNRVLKRSIDYAFQHTEDSAEYIKEHSQETSDDVVQKHISLYVNDFTIDLGEEGKQAIKKMYQLAMGKDVIPTLAPNYFLNS